MPGGKYLVVWQVDTEREYSAEQLDSMLLPRKRTSGEMSLQAELHQEAARKERNDHICTSRCIGSTGRKDKKTLPKLPSEPAPGWCGSAIRDILSFAPQLRCTDTCPAGPLAEPTIAGSTKQERALWASQSVLGQGRPFTSIPMEILDPDNADSTIQVVAKLTQLNLTQSVPGALQFNLHGFAPIAWHLRHLIESLNWGQFDPLTNTQPDGLRRVLRLLDLKTKLRAVVESPFLLHMADRVVLACSKVVAACTVPVGHCANDPGALLLTARDPSREQSKQCATPQSSHVDSNKKHRYSGVIAVTSRAVDFRLKGAEPRYVKMPLLVKDDVHQGRLFESSRCHRGEGDDGQSEPVLKLPLHQGASRTVQIVSIGLHFYFGHSEASSAASELNVCHADSPNGESDYGFHPAAPCISFQELMEELM